MAKYLFEANYTPEGLKGLKQAGAASRMAAISDMCAGSAAVWSPSTSRSVVWMRSWLSTFPMTRRRQPLL
jgi:hypothetical protein